MKAPKTLACLVSCSVALLGVTFSLADFGAAQEGEVKSGQTRTATPLINSLEGIDLFHFYCASCHGVDGKGAGPVAPALNTRIPDLTTISKRNGGLFPAKRIERIIAGDELVIAHGSREMPIWGPIFHQIERDRDYGNVRLLSVTKYVESIQQK
jgi:mono/diheme cytochrome c family protein